MNVFGYNIHKTSVPHHLYNSPQLKQSIDQLYQSPQVLATKTITPEQQGEGYSTSSLSNDLVYSLSNVHPLLDHIGHTILQHHDASNLTFDRVWTNKIYKGCSGRIHRHHRIAHPHITGVAIFYYQVPTHSSQLVIHLAHKEEPCYHIHVEQGDLIIHCDQVPHSVSVHNSTTPRICFIMEYIIE